MNTLISIQLLENKKDLVESNIIYKKKVNYKNENYNITLEVQNATSKNAKETQTSYMLESSDNSITTHRPDYLKGPQNYRPSKHERQLCLHRDLFL